MLLKSQLKSDKDHAQPNTPTPDNRSNLSSFSLLIHFQLTSSTCSPDYLNLLNNKMQSRSYMFSTAKKRSTLLENKGIEFPRDDKAAPRMLIVKKQCPPEYEAFMSCLQNNPGKPQNCVALRQEMFECGKAGFKKANTDPEYIY